MTDKPARTQSAEIVAPAYDQLAQMVTMIPERAEDDAEARILAQIMGSATLEEVDSAWDSNGWANLEGVDIRITGLSRRQSDQASSPTGYYLLVEGKRMDTGQDVTITTGSTLVMAQLVKAWSMDGFPSDWRLIVKENPANGRKSHHLEYMGKPVTLDDGTSF